MCLRLLKNFKSELEGNLVACYAIGWNCPIGENNTFEGFDIATGKTDGEIVCFNTESTTVTTSSMVPEGITSACINPINWSTEAYNNSNNDQENKSISTFYDGTSTSPKNGLDNISGYIKTATISTRGTLQLTFDDNITVGETKVHNSIQKIISDYTASLGTQEGVYHALDYQFFFGNLKQNVVNRLTAYLEEIEEESSGSSSTSA